MWSQDFCSCILTWRFTGIVYIFGENLHVLMNNKALYPANKQDNFHFNVETEQQNEALCL